MTPEDRARHLLAEARRVVVFTGAGVSAESGIPTFRDALTGVWESFDAQALATPRAFRPDPARGHCPPTRPTSRTRDAGCRPT